MAVDLQGRRAATVDLQVAGVLRVGLRSPHVGSRKKEAGRDGQAGDGEVTAEGGREESGWATAR